MRNQCDNMVSAVIERLLLAFPTGNSSQLLCVPLAVAASTSSALPFPVNVIGLRLCSRGFLFSVVWT